MGESQLARCEYRINIRSCWELVLESTKQIWCLPFVTIFLKKIYIKIECIYLIWTSDPNTEDWSYHMLLANSESRKVRSLKLHLGNSIWTSQQRADEQQGLPKNGTEKRRFQWDKTWNDTPFIVDTSCSDWARTQGKVRQCRDNENICPQNIDHQLSCQPLKHNYHHIYGGVHKWGYP